MPDIKIYSTAICPYCVAAKNFLKQRGQSWEEIRVDLDPAVRKEIVEKTGRTSVPQIFINGQHIGGFDDMVALDRAGGLAPLLEAGA
ncbi:MAG: glutaredoxin 3 [Xanthomonadales bacterium]|nr:glutaredoxin 3 [Xanthomonadales bacterium]